MKIAVMFSGGLDSTYVAYVMSLMHDPVVLYNVTASHPLYQDTVRDLAKELDCELRVVAKIKGYWDTRIMRIPFVGAATICNIDMYEGNFDMVATGLNPSTDKADKKQIPLLQKMVDDCMSNVLLTHPGDGVTRREKWDYLPERLRLLTRSCSVGAGTFTHPSGSRCMRSDCYKCVEDKTWSESANTNLMRGLEIK